jgi:hypothetical protein
MAGLLVQQNYKKETETIVLFFIIAYENKLNKNITEEPISS